MAKIDRTVCNELRVCGPRRKLMLFHKPFYFLLHIEPMFAKGSDIRIGQPYLKDVKVTAKVVQHHSDDKVVAYKYRKRKNSASKVGHRQKLTALNITKISV